MSEALNVTKASFGGLREVTTSPLWQYDYGQILQITGLDLPQAFEVHFSNSRKSGETVTQIGTDSQVTIPDMYLTSGADIYCFIFLHDGLTDGETEYVIKIPVRERPEPSDVEPTPEQQDAITEAIAALNVAVEQSETNVEHYPCIIDGYWHVWNAQTEAFVSTGVEAQGEKGDGGLSVFMDIPCDLIPTEADRKMVADYPMSFKVYAFKGSQRQAITDISCSTFSLQTADGRYHKMVMPTAMDGYNYWTVSETIKATVKRVGSSEYEPLYMEHDTEVITLTVTVDGKTFTLKHSVTAAKQGIQGEKGDPGEGAVNVFLRDPVTLIPTDADGCLTEQKIIATYVYAFKDGEPCTITSVTATPVTVQHDPLHLEGIDAVVTVSGTSALVKYTIPTAVALRGDRQIPTITAVVDGETHTATMCIVSARQGETGITPDLTIGTVQTLPAGSQATASITGTDEEPVLNLGLPKGDAGNVQDVQINGTSIVSQGVANVPIAGTNTLGVSKVNDGTYGIKHRSSSDPTLAIRYADESSIKQESSNYRPITPNHQHESTFYGLAKASGDSTQSASSNAVGTYTETAKSKISDMLNAPETVTGTTPTITAKSGIQYICGEVATLDITLPDSGIVDVIFTSGSTPTVLTVTPPTGQTVRWANGFDATSLDADTVYEVNFLNGLGVAQTWSTS